MRMFRRRSSNDSDGTATTTDDRRDYAPTTRSDAVQDDRGAYGRPTRSDAAGGRTWHQGPVRALMTLLGAGVAGLLVWVTSNIGDKSTGGYWAVYGILAGAGLVMALSQLLGGWAKRGRPSFSPTVFVLAFVPTLIAVGWIFLFHQPHSTLFRGDITNWSNDLGIAGLVNDLGGNLLTLLAFGLGLVFGFCFDTTAARRPTPPAREPVSQRTAVDTDADQPIARERERETVRS